MANKGRDQAVWVTEGHEEIVAERYKEIKKIIQENTSMLFKDAIEMVGGVKVGTWYNYISKGTQRGRVSKYTVNKLCEFSDLPYELFTGKIEFSNEHKKQLADKVKEKLEKIYKDEKENGILVMNTLVPTDSGVLEVARVLSNRVDDIKLEETADKLILLLENIIEKISLRKKTIILDEKIQEN
ncbi:hypothetical protein G9F72_024140 [Clostridium estertheticum]|uniref:hypothetical protein n=1 Tax=Clostridium estertheticum TaxID=238834 RepID=UPI0013E98B15|nr:hypothetical protein [Clostridium estertheticum]MBZ9689392.1 hypothetical protein [Clostridium estertheticum]